jgi:hypothetical protein
VDLALLVASIVFGQASLTGRSPLCAYHQGLDKSANLEEALRLSGHACISYRIELIPIRPTREMRGFLKGIDTTIEQEPDRL